MTNPAAPIEAATLQTSADEIVRLACKWYDTGSGKSEVAHELAIAVARYKGLASPPREAAQTSATFVDPTDPGYDVNVLRNHVRALERRVRQLHAERLASAPPAAATVPPQKLSRHKFWGAGEPDCPADIKAPNGELHTARCKVCGDGWRKSVDVCFGATKK